MPILYINHYLTEIEKRSRKFTFKINLIKSILLLAFIWHWSSCFWYFLNDEIEKNEVSTWVKANHINEMSLFWQYLYSSYFTINIATNCGILGLVPYNPLERTVFIMLTYIGDALFALAFGMISSNSEVFLENFANIFEKRKKIKLLLKNKQVPSLISSRIEMYFAYQCGKKSSYGNLTSISNTLSKKIYEDLIFYRAKPFLMTFPIFREASSYFLLRDIAFKLESATYLPGDYIIVRNDVGEEMYFIIEGTVNIMNEREDEVIATLESSDFFGEIALFLDSPKRICSVISNTFCEVFILRKKFLLEILESFPKLKGKFLKECEKRIHEFQMKSKKPKKSILSKSPFYKNINNINSKKILITEESVNLKSEIKTPKENDLNPMSTSLRKMPSEDYLSPKELLNPRDMKKSSIFSHISMINSAMSVSSPRKRNNFYEEKLKNSFINSDEKDEWSKFFLLKTNLNF